MTRLILLITPDLNIPSYSSPSDEIQEQVTLVAILEDQGDPYLRAMMTVPAITSIDLEQVSKSSTLLAIYDMIFVLFIELSIACNTLRRGGRCGNLLLLTLVHKSPTLGIMTG
jgi:hypothetical protein